MAAVSLTKSNADDITFISHHDSIVPDDQGLAGKTASKTSGLHYDLYCSIYHPISFNYKASFIYDLYSHVLRALTLSQLAVIHVLQADPHNRIPACSLDIASIIMLRSRL